MKGEKMIDKAIISIATMACALSWCSSGPRYRKVNISTEALVQDRKKANEDSFSLDETAKICEDHINRYASGNNYRIRYAKIINDFDNNPFLLIEYYPFGYSIYNVSGQDMTEVNFTENLNLENRIARYAPWGDIYLFEDGHYRGFHTNHSLLPEEEVALSSCSHEYCFDVLSEKDKRGAKSGNGSPMTHYPVSNGVVFADTEVPFAWYFKRNINGFPHNGTGICGYTALSMALVYNDIFKTAGYLSSSEFSQYITPYSGALTGYGWAGVPSISNQFPYAMWGNDIGGSTASTLYNAIVDFMFGKNVSYTIYDNGIWGDPCTPVSNGYPAIYLGTMCNPVYAGNINHAVVVYGYYEDDYLLCHFGWTGYTQVKMSKLGLLYRSGTLAIYNQTMHQHRYYFVESLTGDHVCGCGWVLEDEED